MLGGAVLWSCYDTSQNVKSAGSKPRAGRSINKRAAALDGQVPTPGSPGAPDRVSPEPLGAVAEWLRLIRSFLVECEQVARSVGLTADQYEALVAIKGLPSKMRPTTASIADRLSMGVQRTVRLIDQLVQRGLVQRVASSANRRVRLVCLSAAGEAILQRLSEYHRQQLHAHLPVLMAEMAASRPAARPAEAEPSGN